MANPRGRKDEEGAFAPTDSYKRMSVDLEWIVLENSTKPTPFATDTSAPSSDKGRFSLQADNKEAAHAKSELRVEEKGKAGCTLLKRTLPSRKICTGMW